MKLEVEIKDEKFLFSYKVGQSEHHAECALTADRLVAFTNLLDEGSKAWHRSNAECRDELSALAFIQQNPEKARKALKGGKSNV